MFFYSEDLSFLLITMQFAKINVCFSTHASTIRGSVTSGAERVTQSAVNGTKSVAHGVISQSKAVAGKLLDECMYR